jgi:hypothetical protein
LVRRKGGALNGKKEEGAGQPEAAKQQTKNTTKMAQKITKMLENVNIFIWFTIIELDIS